MDTEDADLRLERCHSPRKLVAGVDPVVVQTLARRHRYDLG